MQNNEFIINKLKERNIPFEEIEFTDNAVSARTADTSENHNYNPNNSIKTILVEGKTGVFQLLLRGEDLIDQQKVKSIIGRWRIIPKEVLEHEYGLVVGGICPLTVDFPCIIDESLMNNYIWGMGAGDVNKGLNITKDVAVKNIKIFKIAEIRKLE